MQLCSNTSEELLSTNQTGEAFNGNATKLDLNIQNGNAFVYQGQKLYFRFYSTERQFIKLQIITFRSGIIFCLRKKAIMNFLVQKILPEKLWSLRVSLVILDSFLKEFVLNI